MEIKLNSDDELFLNKMVEIPTIAIVVGAIFLEISKYYLQVFLDECLYKIYIESKNELKEIDIKNRICYHFDKN